MRLYLGIRFILFILFFFLWSCSSFNKTSDLFTAEKDYERHIDRLSLQVQSKDNTIRNLEEKNQILSKKAISLSRSQKLRKAERLGEANLDEYQNESAEPESSVIIYKKLILAYKAKNFKKVHNLAESLLTLHRSDAITGRALYWSGAAYYQEKKYAEALISYDKLLKRFPGNEKTPNAYLGKALIYEKLSLPSVAKGILRKVQVQFKQTSFAKKADILEKKLRR